MRVVEGPSQIAEGAVYTIVGAVARPGAYRTGARSMPLRRMVDIAGGLSPHALSAARIIRNGEIRFQVPLYQEQITANEWLLPGDVVVIPTRSAGATEQLPAVTSIPVTCLGLTSYPVVLPLDPSITTVQELAKRLGQSSQLAQTARVIDPVRGGQTPELAIGTVVIFDARLVNQQPLQPGFLPEIIELDPPRTSAVPGPIPVDLELPPAVPPVPFVQQASADVARLEVSSQNSSSTPPLQSPEALQSSSVPFAQQPAESASSPASSEQETPRLPEVQPKRPLPPDLAHAVSLFSSNADLETTSPDTEFVTAPPEKPNDSGVSAIQTADIAQPDVEAVGVPAVVTPASGIRSGAETGSSGASPRIIRSATPEKSLSGQGNKSLSAKSNAKPSTRSRLLEYLMYGGGALSIVIGISLLVSVVFNAHPVSAPLKSAVETSQIVEQSDAASEADRIEKPEIPRPLPVQDLLNRAIPMVEVPIEIPSAWPLHGKAIGHRRCLLNAAHEELPGPHFRQRQNSPKREKISTGDASTAERLLRNQLREILHSAPGAAGVQFALEDSADLGMNDAASQKSPALNDQIETDVHHSGVDAPTPASNGQTIPPMHASPMAAARSAAAGTESMEFDIVQPQPSPSEQMPAMSPLERALRILAVEKHG